MIGNLLKEFEKWVGYLEKKSNKDLEHKTANAGKNNYTIFAERYKEYTGQNYQAQAWCAMFVSCCFVAAFGLAEAKKLLCGSLYSYCPYGMAAFKNKGQLHTTPKAGDVVFFIRNGVAKHTGWVYKVSGNTIYTIEGNTSGASGVIANGGGVCKKSYTVNGNMYFGRPKYTDQPAANTSTNTSTSTNASVKVDSAKSFDKALSGTYKATTELNVRAGAGTGKQQIDVLKSGEKVECYGYYTSVSGTKWLLIATKDGTGFASSKYLKKI